MIGRRTLLVLLLLLPVSAAAGEVRRGQTVRSGALARDIPYTVYLPAGHARPAARFPVLYLLHGHGGGEADWLDAGGLAATLDRLIAERAVPPMLVVMPGMGNGWYVDNPDPGGLGALETAFIADFVPAVERLWRGAGRRAGRAVAGLSMGGWGAVRFAMLRPDLFVAAASLSGAILETDRAADPAWAGLLAGGFGEPVDLARFRAASPFGMIGRFAGAAQPSLFLTCGDDDELALDAVNQEFNLALLRAGVDPEFRITDGGHDWRVWRRELEPALRFVGAEFGSGG